jgi:hypothetical protein
MNVRHTAREIVRVLIDEQCATATVAADGKVSQYFSSSSSSFLVVIAIVVAVAVARCV